MYAGPEENEWITQYHLTSRFEAAMNWTTYHKLSLRGISLEMVNFLSVAQRCLKHNLVLKKYC